MFINWSCSVFYFQLLDGRAILRSDRIKAEQVRDEARRRVLEQQAAYQKKRVSYKYNSMTE